MQPANQTMDHAVFPREPKDYVRAVLNSRKYAARWDTIEDPYPFLDMTLLNRRLAVTGGPVTPTRLELSDVEKDSLVAFLETLTDRTFLTDPRFSNPFLTAE